MSGVVTTQFTRFLLVGVLNTAFSYIVYACFLRFGMPYPMASFASLVLGILFSFRTQGSLVFGNQSIRLIVRFALCWLVIYLVNVLTIAALVRLGFGAYLSGAFAIAPITILSFLAQKFLVFNATAPRTGMEVPGK